MAKDIAWSTKPTKKAAAQDAWVAGAETTAAAPAKRKAAKKEEKPKMKRLTVEIPAEWHHKMKIKCATEGTNFNTVVNGFVERYLR
jgi:predicted DNA binding CopG/RHH family protein